MPKWHTSHWIRDQHAEGNVKTSRSETEKVQVGCGQWWNPRPDRERKRHAESPSMVTKSDGEANGNNFKGMLDALPTCRDPNLRPHSRTWQPTWQPLTLRDPSVPNTILHWSLVYFVDAAIHGITVLRSWCCSNPIFPFSRGRSVGSAICLRKLLVGAFVVL